MIRYNNTEIEDVHYNGQDKESVSYNGVVVFDGGETTLTIREWGAMDLFWPYGNGRTFTTNETAMAISLATTDNNKYIGEFSVTSSVTKADSYHNSSGSFNVSGPSHIGSGTYLTVIHKPNGYSDGKNYGYMKLTLTLSSPKIDKDYVIETNPGNGDYGEN